MRSLRGRLFYWVLRARRSSMDPASTLAEQRKEIERQLGRLPVPKNIFVESTLAGSRPAEWLRTAEAPRDRAVLYLHGGGYVVGSCRTGRPLAGAIASAAGSAVLVLEYRLAPEHPFPAGLEDAVAAFRWMVDGGIRPERIAIAGDSAGGGLAVATAIALRDRGGPLPGAILCFSPWTDLAVCGDSCATRARVDPIVTREGLLAFAQAYLGGEDARNPLVSPLYADLRGLPPLLIQVGDAEILLSDSAGLADAARAAGVEVTLDTWNGMWHVWQAMAGLVPEGKRAVEGACAFFEECLRSGSREK
jgi:acetyl esterase/lipase